MTDGTETHERPVEVAVGSHFSCARFKAGGVRCWGANDVGQLGDGSRRAHQLPHDVVGIDDATALDAAGDWACVVHEGGAISCWGKETPKPTRVGAIDDAVEVEVGIEHACVLRRGGLVACWGTGAYGELGGGGPEDAAVPVEVPIDGVVDLALTTDTSCALISNGTVWCWGKSPLRGQRSTEPNVERWLEPTELQTAVRFADLEGDRFHICGIVEGGDRTVACFGSSWDCSFGFDVPYDREDQLHEVPGISGARSMASGVCVIDDAGLACWDEEVLTDDALECRRYRVDIDSLDQVAQAPEHSCAVAGGEVLCWGSGGRGQLGNVTLATQLDPRPVHGLQGSSRPQVDPHQAVLGVMEATPQRRYGLLRDDAVLHAVAQLSAHQVRYGTPRRHYVPSLDPEDEPLEPLPVEIVALQGDFVEVVNLGWSEEAAHCGVAERPSREEPPSTDRLTLQGYRLKLYALRRDFLPVLGKAYTKRDEDGSMVELGAGTQVTRLEIGLGAFVGHKWIPLDSSRADFAHSYEPLALAGSEPSQGAELDGCESLDAWNFGHFLGDDVALEEFPYWMIEDERCWIEETGDGHVKAVLRDRCVHAEVLFDEFHWAGVGGLGLMGTGRPATWTIAEGAVAYWNDGTVAGTKRVTEATSVEPRTVDGRSCWNLGHDFELCHDADSVTFTPGDP